MRHVLAVLLALALLPSALVSATEGPSFAWFDMLNDAGFYTQPGRMALDEAHGVLYQVGTAWGRRGPARKAFAGAFVAKYSLDGEREWLRIYDDELPGYGYGIGVGPDGNVYLVGIAPGTEATGATDSVLVALRPDGSVRWTRRLEGETIDGLFTVAVHGDRVLVGGSLFDPTGATECERRETAFVAEYDTEGHWRYFTRWGGPSIIKSVAFGPGGNAIVAGGRGHDCGTASASPGSGGFVSRLDRRGMIRRTEFAAGLGTIEGIAFGHGAMYLLGSHHIKLPPYEGGTAAVARMGRGGSILWTRSLTLGEKPIEGSALSASGLLVAVAGSTDNALDPPKAALIVLRANGTFSSRWEVPDSKGYSHATAVAVLADGDVAVGAFAADRIGEERPFGRGSAWLARLRFE